MGPKGRAFSEIHLLLCPDLSQLRIAASECVENTAPAGRPRVVGVVGCPGTEVDGSMVSKTGYKPNIPHL